MEDGTDLVFRAAASTYQGVALAELAIANGFTDTPQSHANDDHNAAIAEVFAQPTRAWAVITANEAHEPNSILSFRKLRQSVQLPKKPRLVLVPTAPAVSH
jgi:hypothetical protein